MDTQKVQLIIQYALAVAGESDDFKDRELGPIHLLKYIYLADLAYAQEEGQTFTGTDWKFHDFGPWSVEAFNQIPGAAERIGAVERRFRSQFKDEDVRRWRVQSNSLADKLDPLLPRSVASTLRRAVRKHGNDTSSLLHDVYRTPPMLNAAPGDLLEFCRASKAGPGAAPLTTDALPQMSKTKAQALKSRVQARLREKLAKKTTSLDPAPRYDDVFEQGRQWLDGLAGEPVEPMSGRLKISDAVWKSAARREPELP